MAAHNRLLADSTHSAWATALTSHAHPVNESDQLSRCSIVSQVLGLAFRSGIEAVLSRVRPIAPNAV